MTKLTDATRNKLKTVSTATVATALFKRGLRIQMIQDVHPLSPDQPTLVGEAFTLRYMPAREDLNKIDVFRDRAHPQRKAIEDCPVGAVLVMDSRKDARAASAGAILVTRLMQRGCAGVITDGGFRDSAEIAKLGFPAYHHRPSAPTNLTLHQAIEINVPIGCGDAPVFPGDVILGDSDGVIVIPAHLVDEIADETVEMTAFEDFVTEQVQKGRSILGIPTSRTAERGIFCRTGGKSCAPLRRRPGLDPGPIATVLYCYQERRLLCKTDRSHGISQRSREEDGIRRQCADQAITIFAR